MIGYIRGKLLIKKPNYVLIEAGGIGYLVNIPLSTYYKLSDNKEAEIYIHTKIREDQISLYGFSDENEKQIFEKIISISGVGPKTALALLSGLSIEELYQVIEKQDVKKLCKIPGIGSKTAQRILLEIKDKIRSKDSNVPQTLTVNEELKKDLISALINLGYSTKESEEVVNTVLKRNDNSDISYLLKECLKILTKA